MKRFCERLVFIITFTCICNLLSGQDTITLNECLNSARNNYPLIRKYDLIRKAGDYNLENASRSYLPQASLSASASWQSDVTSLPIKIPDVAIPQLSKDQYRVQLELNQMIWDGGVMRSRKDQIKAQNQVEIQQLEVDLYAINEQVMQIYFSILLIQDQLRLNQLLREDLTRNLKKLESLLQFGMTTETDLDLVRVSILDASQQLIEIESSLRKYRDMLTQFTGISFSENHQLIKPLAIMPEAWEICRPELSLFAAGVERIESRRKVLVASTHPQIGAFVQGLFGKPGLDMLQNNPAFGFVAGVKFSYLLGNLYTLKQDRKLLRNEQLRIDADRETFRFHVRMQLNEQENELLRVRKLMLKDDELIRLQNNIVQASEMKLAHGTIEVNDLLYDISQENRARLRKALHEIESVMTVWKMKYITNNYEE